MDTTLSVIHGDVRGTPCDVLVLKHAGLFLGADLAVVRALGLRSDGNGVARGRHQFVPTDGKIPVGIVLFLGVEDLFEFGYAEIRGFARRALDTLAVAAVPRDSVAMTMHGAGYGLDEREAFAAQVGGLLDHLLRAPPAWRPQRITFVEQDASRAKRMAAHLEQILAAAGLGTGGTPDPAPPPVLPDAGVRSAAKRHVFVAMPYTEAMEDVFEFGVRQPVNDAGYLCERCDKDIFTGDILTRIKDRIAAAAVVVADLTGANPNVYLEVGYAWGKGVPTLLVAREGEELKFDVKTQKCVYYRSINHLRKQLAEHMAGLLGGR